MKPLTAGGANVVEIFYVTTGGSPSGGTMASGISVMLRPGFAFRGGRLTGERQGARVAAYRWGARSGAGMSISGRPSISLPRLHRELRDVGVYLGVPGAQTWQLRAAAAAVAAQVIEPLGRMVERGVVDGGARSTGGPSESARRRARAGVLASALDDSGDRLAEVRLEGGDPYEFTAAILVWGRHGPPRVSSGPAGRWVPLRRSTSTISTVAPKTPACGPCATIVRTSRSPARRRRARTRAGVAGGVAHMLQTTSR